jgi:arsenite methyltransferase
MTTRPGAPIVGAGSDPLASVADQVRAYYGAVIGSSDDLLTGACRPDASSSLPRGQREALSLIHPEILERSYGCGSPIPPAIEGRRVLDLGCGAGRDAFVASRLVGAGGSVMGVDMTEEPLAIARRHVAGHTARFGYDRPNVEFRTGDFGDLAACGLVDGSVDVVISNCAINLAADKERVFAEIFRVLRRGGELCFADVFADRRVPAALASDPVLLGECLAGALYAGDFRRIMRRAGCLDHRVVERRRVALGNDGIEARVGAVGFTSMTVRAFRLGGLEDACEDYGQVATYLGTIEDLPHRFRLDEDHTFETGRPLPVCGNTAAMLGGTRFAPHFRLDGDRGTHFGRFPCGAGVASRSADNDGEGGRGGACC